MSSTRSAVVFASLATGSVLVAADIGGAVRTAVVLWVLLAVPGIAAWPVLPGESRLGRALLAGMVGVVADVLAALVVLYAGVWSEGAGYGAVSLGVVAIVAAQLLVERARSRQQRGSGPSTSPLGH